MDIQIYGALWCKNTKVVIQGFDQYNIPYTLLQIDDKENGKEYTQKVIEMNNGKRILPTLIMDNKTYSNPTKEDIQMIIKNIQEEDNSTRCSNGKILEDGDSVLLTRDLDVKSSQLKLKQGTAIEKIKLTSDPNYIGCRIGKSNIAIKTMFVKKKG